VAVEKDLYTCDLRSLELVDGRELESAADTASSTARIAALVGEVVSRSTPRRTRRSRRPGPHVSRPVGRRGFGDQRNIDVWYSAWAGVQAMPLRDDELPNASPVAEGDDVVRSVHADDSPVEPNVIVGTETQHVLHRVGAVVGPAHRAEMHAFGVRWPRAGWRG